jgi:hypothetical protein
VINVTGRWLLAVTELVIALDVSALPAGQCPLSHDSNLWRKMQDVCWRVTAHWSTEASQAHIMLAFYVAPFLVLLPHLSLCRQVLAQPTFPVSCGLWISRLHDSNQQPLGWDADALTTTPPIGVQTYDVIPSLLNASTQPTEQSDRGYCRLYVIQL